MRVGPKGPVGAGSAGEPVNPRLRAQSQRVSEVGQQVLGRPINRMVRRTTAPDVTKIARAHGLETKRGK